MKRKIFPQTFIVQVDGPNGRSSVAPAFCAAYARSRSRVIMRDAILFDWYTADEVLLDDAL